MPDENSSRRRAPRFGGRWTARDVAPLASLLVLVVFFTLATDNFLSQRTATQVLKQGAVLAIVASGLTFVLLAGEIDLAVGMLATWTACFCGWLYEWSTSGAADGASVSAGMLILALGVPLASTLALGLVSGGLTVWSRLPSFIITLAMMNIADGAARYLSKSETRPVPQMLESLGNSGWQLTERLTLPYGAVVAALVMLAGHVVLTHTRLGRYIYMTGGNREAARLAGVRTGQMVIVCLAISAVTAGLGGLVNAGRLSSTSVLQNADLLLSAVACVVLGGTSLFGGEGSMGQTLVGVLTFTVLKVGLNQIDWIDDMARHLLMGLVLMTALVINGVLAKRAQTG